jgi:hypothetical protein
MMFYVFVCCIARMRCLLLPPDDERDELPAAALSATMTTPLTPRGAPLSHANSSSAAAVAAAAALTPPPTALGGAFAGPPGGTPAAAAAADVGLPRPTGAFGTPQQSSSFARSAAVAAAAAAGGVGPVTPAGGEGGQRQMLSTPSFTHLRELWGQLSPEEVQERLSLAGGCVKGGSRAYKAVLGVCGCVQGSAVLAQRQVVAREGTHSA